MSTPPKHQHHVIAGHFAEAMDVALTHYKAGEEEVAWTFNEFTFTLRNLRDNADREVVRFTLAELREFACALVMYGARRAGHVIAHSVAVEFGLIDEPQRDGDGEVKP